MLMSAWRIDVCVMEEPVEIYREVSRARVQRDSLLIGSHRPVMVSETTTATTNYITRNIHKYNLQ